MQRSCFRPLSCGLGVFLFVGAVMLVPVRRAEAQNPVSWALVLPDGKKTLSPDSKALVTLKATIDGGWHIYAPSQAPGGPVAMRVTIVKNPIFASADSLKQEAPDTKFDANFGINVQTYENQAVFGLPIAVGHVKDGTDTLKVAVRYQACTESMCLPVKTQTVALPVPIEK